MEKINFQLVPGVRLEKREPVRKEGAGQKRLLEILYVKPQKPSLLSELNHLNLVGGGHWGFRFCGFGQFLIRFFGFRS